MIKFYDYKDKIDPEKVLVCLSVNSTSPFYKNLATEIQNKSKQYGFTFFEYDQLDSSRLNQEYTVKHLIHLNQSDDISSLLNQHKSLLENFHTMSLGTVYTSQQAMQKVEPIINQLKKTFGSRVNFLRPDSACPKTGMQFVSQQKIVDNSICDSVRIKYIPLRIERDISSLISEYLPFFTSCAEVFKRKKLYHRSVTDGFFAVRCTEGFLITATKTDKVKMDPERISLVYKYDEAKNEIAFSGKYLPSSDVVEASITFRTCSKIHSLVHTHASTHFTRNPSFSSRIKIPKLPYGEPTLGYRISEVIRDYPDNFIIMDDHGEVFNFSQLGDLKKPAQYVDFFVSMSEKNELLMQMN